MPKIPQNVLSLFPEKVNLLIVDDDPVVLDAVTALFSSPLFNITTASTLKHAFSIINSSQKPWHCWILDIALEEETDGFKILETYQQFPFTVMLSGLRSMTTASLALQHGAMKVFDKNPASLDLLFDEVCKASALGYILDGKATQYLSNYILLKENSFANSDEWANCACITVRQLERICAMHSSMTPRYVLSLYYSLYFLLSAETDDEISAPDEEGEDSPIADGSDFYLSHMSFFEKHIEKYRESVFSKVSL